MSQIGDYVIWVGENIESQYPTFTWEQIMDMVVRGQFDEEKYSIENYLNETYAGKEKRNGKSQQASSESGSDGDVPREYHVAISSESHAGQSSVRDMAKQTGTQGLYQGRYPFTPV